MIQRQCSVSRDQYLCLPCGSGRPNPGRPHLCLRTKSLLVAVSSPLQFNYTAISVFSLFFPLPLLSLSYLCPIQTHAQRPQPRRTSPWDVSPIAPRSSLPFLLTWVLLQPSASGVLQLPFSQLAITPASLYREFVLKVKAEVVVSSL